MLSLVSTLVASARAETVLIGADKAYLISGRGFKAILAVSPNAAKPAATYKYRIFRDKREVSGKGEVFEKYKEVDRAAGVKSLKDDRGQLYVQMAGVKIEWSYESPKGGYLYLDDGMTCREVSLKKYESIPLR